MSNTNKRLSIDLSHYSSGSSNTATPSDDVIEQIENSGIGIENGDGDGDNIGDNNDDDYHGFEGDFTDIANTTSTSPSSSSDTLIKLKDKLREAQLKRGDNNNNNIQLNSNKSIYMINTINTELNNIKQNIINSIENYENSDKIQFKILIEIINKLISIFETPIKLNNNNNNINNEKDFQKLIESSSINLLQNIENVTITLKNLVESIIIKTEYDQQINSNNNNNNKDNDNNITNQVEKINSNLKINVLDKIKNLKLQKQQRLELKSQHDELDSIALKNSIIIIDNNIDEIGSIKNNEDNDNDEFEDSDDEIEPHFNQYRNMDNSLIRSSPLGNDRRRSLRDGIHLQQQQQKRNSQSFKSPQNNRFQQQNKQNNYHRQSMYIPSNRTSVNGGNNIFGRAMSLRSVPTSSLQFHDIQTNNFTNNVNHTSTINNSMLDYSKPTRYSFNDGHGNGNGNGDMYLNHSPSISESYYDDESNDFINDDIIDSVQFNDIYHEDEGTDTIHQRSPVLNQHFQMRSPRQQQNQYRQQQHQQQQQQQQYFDSNQSPPDRDTGNFRKPSLMSMSTNSGSTRYGVSSHLRPIDDKYYSNNNTTNINNGRYDLVQSRNATSRLSNLSKMSNNSRFGYNNNDDIEDNNQQYNNNNNSNNNNLNHYNSNITGIRSRPVSHLGTYSNNTNNGNEINNNRTRNTSSNNAYKRQSVRF
ncbi:hypothetical protein B5S31_g2590 [[Candida] boidinii]|nr:hypothetical protein B5S31_g2590 [[Candida] boidinii]